MKIKPIYFLISILFLSAAFLIFSNLGSEEKTSQIPEDEIHKDLKSDQMPQDDIHRNLSPSDKSRPSRENVNESTKKMLEAMEKKIQQNPKDTAALRNYADFLTAAHQQDKAITIYEDIIKIDPEKTSAHLSLASIYYGKGDLDKAESHTQKVLSYEENNAYAYFNMGAIAAARGDDKKAVKIWEDVVRKYPGTDIANFAAEALKDFK